MIYISHRGNLSGPNPDLENRPDYIDRALNFKYFVEVDVWHEKGWWLGHDKPQYKMPDSFFGQKSKRLFFHAKNSTALEKLQKKSKNFHFFWHQEDDYALTSLGFIWVYPGKKLLKRSICVLPEKGYIGNIKDCYGICSDKIVEFQGL